MVLQNTFGTVGEKLVQLLIIFVKNRKSNVIQCIQGRLFSRNFLVYGHMASTPVCSNGSTDQILFLTQAEFL